jgi:hypothetical protein
MTSLRTLIPLLLVLGCLPLAACGGGGASASPAPTPVTLTLRPTQFTPSLGDPGFRLDPGLLGCTVPSAVVLATNVTFHAELTLPAGVEITAVKHFHVGTSANAFTQTTLWRARPSTGSEFLWSGSSSTLTGAGPPEEVTGAPVAMPPILVDPDFTYWVSVTVQNGESSVTGVSLTYQ